MSKTPETCIENGTPPSARGGWPPNEKFGGQSLLLGTSSKNRFYPLFDAFDKIFHKKVNFYKMSKLPETCIENGATPSARGGWPPNEKFGGQSLLLGTSSKN